MKWMTQKTEVAFPAYLWLQLENTHLSMYVFDYNSNTFSVFDSSYVFTQSLGRAAFYETNSNCWKSCDSRAFFTSSNITRIQWVAACLWELATGLARQMCFNKALTCTTGKKLTDTTSEVYVAVYGAGKKETKVITWPTQLLLAAMIGWLQ